MDESLNVRRISSERWTELMARWATGLGVAGAIVVAVAWHQWPDGERLAFEISFSIGMLGVNAAWLLGVIAVMRECWRTKFSGLRWRVLVWAGGAIAVAEGVFW